MENRTLTVNQYWLVGLVLDIVEFLYLIAFNMIEWMKKTFINQSYDFKRLTTVLTQYRMDFPLGFLFHTEPTAAMRCLYCCGIQGGKDWKHLTTTSQSTIFQTCPS